MQVIYPLSRVKRHSLRRGLVSQMLRSSNALLKMAVRVKGPQFVIIETVNKCNIKCPVCWVPDMKRQKGVMTNDQFASIIDQLPSGITMVPYNAGEPLLDKGIWTKIRYAHEHGMKVIISTNGSLLDKYDPVEILSSGLQSISVTIESTMKDVHENYRRGSNYEKVIEGLRRLCVTKKSYLMSIPRL